MSWVDDEFEQLNLGDQRLNHRTKRVVEALEAAPQVSLPRALGGWSEVKGAYRLFANAEVTPEELLSPHIAMTHKRMAGQPVVLCLNDTTEVEFNAHSAALGLGPLAYEFQSGFLLHPLLAVTPDRRCLGLLDAQWLVRDPDRHGQSVATKKRRPLEKKESHRWPAAFAQVCAQAALVPDSRLVYVADRESDIYELLLAAQGAPADLLIRCNQNRALKDGGKIHAATKGIAPLGTVEIAVPRSHGRAERTARLTLRAARVTVRPPFRKGTKLEEITITVVHALEERPPKGSAALNWILLTNREANTLDGASTLLSWYVCRWQIEVYFRVLKVGCGIEKLQLGSYDRLRTAIAIYLIVAWRIQYLLSMGRSHPDLPCDEHFDAEEWRAAWIVSKRTPPPAKPPKLQEMIRIVACLGGFLGRKSDGNPGAQTLWIGLEKVRHFAMAFAIQAEMARIQAEKTSKSKRRR